jgi:hypothetical protein
MLGYNVGIVVVFMSGFPCKEDLHKRGFIRVSEKEKNLYVLFAFRKCLLAMITFDFWTSMGAHDIFALLVSFISTNW